jgi:hypothetical protein
VDPRLAADFVGRRANAGDLPPERGSISVIKPLDQIGDGLGWVTGSRLVQNPASPAEQRLQFADALALQSTDTLQLHDIRRLQGSALSGQHVPQGGLGRLQVGEHPPDFRAKVRFQPESLP